MTFRAALFDLDGTLLNTLADIAAAMNAALVELGAPVFPLEAYRGFVGHGLEILAAQVLPQGRRDEATIAACVAAMRKTYARTWAHMTKPYPGMVELLEALASKQIKTAVLSNKAEDFVRTMVASFFGAHPFSAVFGKSEVFPAKPDPAAALHIAAMMQVQPQQCLFIGDSDIDMHTASSAGMYPVGVLWGFRTADELTASGAKALLSHPAQLLDLPLASA